MDCFVGGGWYFPYYSYRRNPKGWEFFIPAGTLIAVKLLKYSSIFLALDIAILAPGIFLSEQKIYSILDWQPARH